jgi:mannitol 2-dehydrogenase
MHSTGVGRLADMNPQQEPTRLSLRNLNRFSHALATPGYDRDSLMPGILHIGVGNFHRAHQAVYLDDLFNRGIDFDWAIIGAGIRAHDSAMRDALREQDWLTTVVEMDPEGNRARVTGAMVEFLPVGNDGLKIVRALSDPSIRIASLTVTEGGYCIDPATGEFDPQHPEILYDTEHFERPKGVFGILLAALDARRENGVPPFTVMSCDNVPGNGQVARNAVTGLAEMVEPSLARYVREYVQFPDSMVDRITPATTDAQREILSRTFGLGDNWPVFCEPFRQWVMEDRFSTGRPRLEEVGATLVGDVKPFELMKIRILNGSHAAIAYPAALIGIHFVHDAMAHPLIRAYLDKLAHEEIIPMVPAVPGVSLPDYFAEVAQRFANPEVGDTIPRLCQDGSNRQPKFILASTFDRVTAGEPIAGLALESALWCRYCAGTADDGRSIEIDDVNADALQRAAAAARENPDAFLVLDNIFDEAIARSPAFRKAFANALRSLWREGTEATLQDYVAGRHA